MGLLTSALSGAAIIDEMRAREERDARRKAAAAGPRLPSEPERAIEESRAPFPLPSKASEKYLRDLLLKRQLPPDAGRSGDERAAEALRMLDAGEMSQEVCSKSIDRLKHLPRKDTPPKDGSPSTVLMLPGKDALPTGRYAIEAANGELRFYRLWRGTRNPDYVEIHVQHGPEESKVPWSQEGYRTIMQSIIEYGAGACALRYGHEIGCCSICGLRLTNWLSRELGIGPVCGGRFFEPGEWRRRKADARSELRREGKDPNASVPDAELDDRRPFE